MISRNHHSIIFIQQAFIKCLLCGRDCSSAWDTSANKPKILALMELISQLWGRGRNRQNKHINIITKETVCSLEGDKYDGKK